MPAKKRDPRLARAGVSGYNKPKRTPSHPTKSHVVVAKEGDKIKTIRYGQQGVSGAGKNPKTASEKARRKSFKARHAKNIAKGKMSAAYWANKSKWQGETIMPMVGKKKYPYTKAGKTAAKKAAAKSGKKVKKAKGKY